MNLKEALTIADKLVHAERGKGLDSLEKDIFQCTWKGNKYAQIENKSGKSVGYIAHKASKLWNTMSLPLNKMRLLGEEEKISKSNLEAILERYQANISKKEEIKASQSAFPAKNLPFPYFEPLTQLTNNSPTLTQKQESTTTTNVSVLTDSAITSTPTQLEDPNAPVAIGSNFYIERPPIESECYQAILRPGALIRIKSPRKMGKTSLMMRVVDYAAQQSYHTVSLNFQEADEEIFSSLKKFLQWFSASVAWGLQLPDRIEDYWKDIFGSKSSCSNYFQNHLLSQLEQPLVLALDKIDCIFSEPTLTLANDFFALLRTWYEKAQKNDNTWRKMRLILVHSEEIISLNHNRSPFNVGLPIELPEFSSQQIIALARRHGLDWNDVEIKELMAAVGGHPYLVRHALYGLAQKSQNLEEFLELNLTETAPYKDYLIKSAEKFI